MDMTQTRVAVITIIVEQDSSTDQLNQLLSEAKDFIIGRMGIPYRQKGINIISVAIDAPQDVSLGKLEVGLAAAPPNVEALGGILTETMDAANRVRDVHRPPFTPDFWLVCNRHRGNRESDGERKHGQQPSHLKTSLIIVFRSKHSTSLRKTPTGQVSPRQCAARRQRSARSGEDATRRP